MAHLATSQDARPLEEPTTLSTSIPIAPLARSTSNSSTDRRKATNRLPMTAGSDEDEDSTTTLHETEPESSATVEGKKEGKEDLEKGASGGEEGEEKERYYSKEDGSEIIVVEWKGPDDPANPLNWSNGRRMVSTFMFVQSISSYSR